MRRARRNFTGEEKVAILRRHLLDKVSVSELCEELGLQPAQFYQWQKQFFEQGAAAFERNGKPKADKTQERIAALEAKLRRKDEVLGELMEEHVALKKNLGNSEGRLGSPRYARRRDGFCQRVVGQGGYLRHAFCLVVGTGLE